MAAKKKAIVKTATAEVVRIEPVPDLAGVMKVAETALGYLRGLSIVAPEGLSEADGWLRSVIDERKRLKADRLSRVTEPKRMLKAIDAAYKVPDDALAEAEAELRRVIGAYKLEADRKLASGYAAAAVGLQLGEHQLAAAALNEAETHRAGLDGTGVKAQWVLVDIPAPELVPRQWCDPSEKRLAAMAKAWPTQGAPPDVPGCVFALQGKVTVR